MTPSLLGGSKFLLFLVVYALAVHQVASQDEFSSEEDSAKEVSSRSGSCRAIFNHPGACIRLRRCEPIMRLIRYRPFLARKVIRRSICGRSFIEPLVCCPEFESDEDSGENNSNNDNSNENNSNNDNSNENNSNNDNSNENNSNNDNSNENNSSTENSHNIEESNTERPNVVQPPLQPPECGRSNKPHNRVVGGSPAEVGAWPWIANLGYETDDPNIVVFLCGASLISSRHLVTAGHCVYNVKKFFVRLGEHDLRSDDDGANPIDIPVEKVTIHPDYNHDDLENDIAILKLAKEVEFTDAIHPVCLPVADDIKNRNFVNNYPFVAGWGKTSTNGPSSDVLRETQVPVVDEETCRKNYRNVKNVVVDNRLICAGYTKGGKDACQGDSGGPLMFPIKQNYYLIGVVSGGYHCAEPDTPGLYTRVTSFLDFILSNMN